MNEQIKGFEEAYEKALADFQKALRKPWEAFKKALANRDTNAIDQAWKALQKALASEAGDIEALKFTIITWSLLAAQPINDAWASLTGEDPMSVKSNSIVRSEVLWFFLHMMDRYAFSIGGPEVRATLQDAIVENAIQDVLIASFDTSHAKKGFDTKEWLSRMATSALEEFNEAGLDYSSCKTLGVEGKGDFAREGTILGKLAARINHLVGQGYNIQLRLLIWATAVESLSKSRLKEQVEKTCNILR
jgi:hypothetical protein